MTELSQRPKVAYRPYASHRVIAWVGFVAALLGLSLLLNLPNWPGFLLGDTHRRLSAEVLVAFVVIGVAIEAALPAGWRRRALRPLLAAVLLVLAALRLADLVVNLALGRPVNLALDLPLLPSLLEVITAGEPPIVIAGAALAVMAGLLALGWGIVAALAAAERFLETSRRRRGFLAVMGLIVLLGASGSAHPFPPAGWSATALALGQIEMAAGAARERAALAARLAEDPWAKAPAEGLLARLRGRNVYLVFIESYGESALADDRFRPIIAPLLRQADARLQARGWTLRTGLLRSPVRGGRSWLAHATLVGGVRLPEQVHYTAALTARRTSLAHLFDRAGYRTIAIMPGMRRPWPEGAIWGFQDVWVAERIGYAGPPFDWSTMPDQFVLSRLAGLPGEPRFVQVVLTSSHGPWKPIPRLLADWEMLGDGRLFHDLPPSEPPWPELDGRYAGALAYSLSAVFDWVERRLKEDALILVLGDHQPAPLITGPGASDAVPIHVLARDPALAEAFADWGFAEGLMPDGLRPMPMEDFRDRFLASFSAPGD